MDDDLDVRGPRLMDGAGLGLGLALLNTLVIALGLGGVAHTVAIVPLVLV